MTFSLYGLIVGSAFALSFLLAQTLLTRDDKSKQAESSLNYLMLSVFGLGLLGARLYHVITDWHLYTQNPIAALYVWQGGLGLYGGLIGGVLAIWFWKKIWKPRWKMLTLIDVAAIAMPFGQAVGRWGNFVNQELYGRPTSAPWGIYIDPAHRLPTLANVEYYHPLFLYESVGCLLIGLGLYFLWRMGHNSKLEYTRIGSGLFTGLYLLWYPMVRFNLEFLRLESAAGAFDLTVAQLISLGLMIVGLILLIWSTNKKLLALASIATAFITIVITPTTAMAQQTSPFELSLSPTVVEIAIQPGKLVTQAFLIENSGTLDLEVIPVLRDFESDGRSGQAILKQSSTFPYGQLQNADIRLNQPFRLNANSSQQLILGLNVPDDAARRDWYFSLLLQTRPVSEGQLVGSGAQTRGGIAANVLVRVTTDNLEPLGWNIAFDTPGMVDSLQSIVVRPMVTNLSQTVAAPQMNIVILDWRGEIVYEKDALPDRILAGSQREMYAAQQRRDDPRSFEPVEFRYDPLFAIGHYRVRATIRNAQDGPVVVEKTILAAPFSLLIATLTIVAVLVASRLRRRQLAKALGQPADK